MDSTATAPDSSFLARLAAIRDTPLGERSSVRHVVGEVRRRIVDEEPAAVKLDFAAFNSSI